MKRKSSKKLCWFQICRRGDAWGELGAEVKWLNPQWGHLLLHLVIYPLPLFAGMRRNSLEVTSKLQTWTWLYFIAKNIWKHVVWPSFNSMNLRYIEMMTKSCLSYLFVYDVPLAMFDASLFGDKICAVGKFLGQCRKSGASMLLEWGIPIICSRFMKL